MNVLKALAFLVAGVLFLPAVLSMIASLTDTSDTLFTLTGLPALFVDAAPFIAIGSVFIVALLLLRGGGNDRNDGQGGE